MSKENMLDLALFILRLTLGGIFLAHGLQKLGVFGGEAVTGFAGMLQGLGMPNAETHAWAVSIIETAAGALLIFGILPRLSALSIAVIMSAAVIKVHAPKGFFMMDGGYEYPLLIIAASLVILLAGAGKISLMNKG